MQADKQIYTYTKLQAKHAYTYVGAANYENKVSPPQPASRSGVCVVISSCLNARGHVTMTHRYKNHSSPIDQMT